MRIKFIYSVVAVSWCYQPGEVHDVPEPAASQYVEQGIALVADDDEIDSATVGGADERAVLPRAKARR